MNVKGLGIFPCCRRNQQQQQNQIRPSSYSSKSSSKSIASSSKDKGLAPPGRGMVMLKNGEKEDITVVDETMKSLASVHSSHPLAFIHLYKKCVNPEFKILSADKKVLIENKLMQPDGSINSAVRNTVISGVIFDDYNIICDRAYISSRWHSFSSSSLK
jgi:hypothetical protein